MKTHQLQEFFRLHRPGHSQLQMGSFVVARTGGTDYGCFKQAVRELSTRYVGLKSAGLRRKTLEAKIEKAKARGKRLKELGLLSRLDDLEKSLDHAVREFAYFYALAEHYRAKLPAELTDEKIEELEIGLWAHHLKRIAGLELLSTGHISIGTLEGIGSMPPKIRDELFRLAEEDPTSLENWAKQAVPVLPSAKELSPSITEMQIRELVSDTNHK